MLVDDLDNVNPKGRFDVLAYRGAQHVIQNVENQSGLQGLWDNIKPHVGKFIQNSLSGVEIPTEAKVLLSIMQANINKGETK